MPHYDYLIVGAGFAGAVLAERLASQLNKRCLVIDRRSHVAGNAYDFHDRIGVLVHQYGPHYFRTNSERVRDYLGQLTGWTPVNYRVLNWIDGCYWPLPINLNTFELLVGHPSSPEEMAATLDERAGAGPSWAGRQYPDRAPQRQGRAGQIVDLPGIVRDRPGVETNGLPILPIFRLSSQDPPPQGRQPPFQSGGPVWSSRAPLVSNSK